jgi:hypothetical protein
MVICHSSRRVVSLRGSWPEQRLGEPEDSEQLAPADQAERWNVTLSCTGCVTTFSREIGAAEQALKGYGSNAATDSISDIAFDPSRGYSKEYEHSSFNPTYQQTLWYPAGLLCLQ